MKYESIVLKYLKLKNNDMSKRKLIIYGQKKTNNKLIMIWAEVS